MLARFNRRAHHHKVSRTIEEMREALKLDSEVARISQLEELREKNEKQFLEVAQRRSKFFFISVAAITLLAVGAVAATFAFPVLSSGIIVSLAAAGAAAEVISVVKSLYDKREEDRDKRIVREAIDERIQCLQTKLYLSDFYGAGMRDKFNRNSPSEKAFKDLAERVNPEKNKHKPRQFNASLILKWG
ncbi:MAG: hypothetical protein V1721_07640 [Pseudomonadota bacterium]